VTTFGCCPRWGISHKNGRIHQWIRQSCWPPCCRSESSWFNKKIGVTVFLPFFCLPIRLPFCPSVCLFAHLSSCLYSASLTACQPGPPVFFFSVRMPVSLSVSLFVCLPVCLSLFQSVCQSVSLSVCQSVSLSVRLSVSQSLNLSVCKSLSYRLSVRQHVCLLDFLSVCVRPYVIVSLCRPAKTFVCQPGCLTTIGLSLPAAFSNHPPASPQV
jgi:hypothetical protein